MIKLKQGDCLDVLRKAPSDYADSLVTDPPAGISFMGKAWDDDKGGRKQWIAWMTEVMTEAMRVLKPGAHGLVWALPRTSHWTATALEDAGFEVRDVVTHLFGTGFPKSLDISKAIDKVAGAEREVIGRAINSYPDSGRKDPYRDGGGKVFDQGAGLKQNLITAPATDAARQWQGWGTALKPASEHWILIRKPCSEKTVAANVLAHGTGGINIDACRIEGKVPSVSKPDGGATSFGSINDDGWKPIKSEFPGNPQGRFPSNLILDEDAAAALDEQSGTLKTNPGKAKTNHKAGTFGVETQVGRVLSDGSEGGASRFFYVAKASKSDKGADNTHPTVKSTALMSYLIKLVTPPGGTVLDPFMGSGSTGVAAVAGGFKFVGIEQSEEYFAIASKRVSNDK